MALLLYFVVVVVVVVIVVVVVVVVSICTANNKQDVLEQHLYLFNTNGKRTNITEYKYERIPPKVRNQTTSTMKT